MTSKVAALCKSFLTERAFKGSSACVLSEMVPEVAALLEHATTVGVLAFEI
jgi:hypothetical protein